MNETLFQDPTENPPQDYLSELVGDSKKFKTAEELARGKWESDQYIKTLLLKHDQLKEDYLRVMEENKAKAKLEELIDQMKNDQQLSSSEQPTAKEVQKPELDLSNIEELVSKKIREREAETKEGANFKVVMDKLKERYAHNYANVLREQASFLGMSEDDVNSLARKSPQAFFRIMGLDEQPKGESFQAPPRSNQISSSFKPKEEKRTWSYYQKLRKENPRAWLDPKTTDQFHKDYIALGKEFEDGDFRRFGDGL